MQGVIAGWVGQSFVLPRCSASSENKTRTRRTKEERRTMVMSFITKYQKLNNGKFPSLNLTHKEVGGSFYTVREIVRDIIQENKVLGPGKPSSKLLNFEYSSEEGEDEGSILDVHRNKSVPAIVNEVDQVHHEVASSLEQKFSSDDYSAVDKPVPLILSNTYLNEYISWPLLQDEPNEEKFSDAIVLHEEVAKKGTEESIIHALLEKEEDASGGSHQINDEVQLRSPEAVCIQYTKQSVPLRPTSSGTSFIETELKSGDTKIKIPGATHYLEEGANISVTAFAESLSETNMFFSDILEDQSNSPSTNYKGEVFPLVTDIFGQDNSTETQIFAISNLSNISMSGQKVHLVSGPFEKGDALNSSELETYGLNNIDDISSISESSNIANKGVISGKEHLISGEETGKIASFDERKVDLASEATKRDIHIVDNFGNFDDAIKESEIASSKLLKPIIQDAEFTKLGSEKQPVTSGTMNGVGFMSSSKEKATKDETLRVNPAWDAIKSFVSSFIKFWSE